MSLANLICRNKILYTNSCTTLISMILLLQIKYYYIKTNMTEKNESQFLVYKYSPVHSKLYNSRTAVRQHERPAAAQKHTACAKGTWHSINTRAICNSTRPWGCFIPAQYELTTALVWPPAYAMSCISFQTALC